MIGVWWSRIRNCLYDKHYLSCYRSKSFVISLGNLSWGGTGKTSLAMLMAKRLISRGYRVAIVSRGYGRRTVGMRLVSDGKQILESWESVGDEPYLLAQKVPGVTVIVSEDRTRAMRYLEELHPDVILLDDGFQHRRVARDLDIVLLDASENLLEQKGIPFGKLREPLVALKRANAVVLTHSRYSSQITLNWIQAHLTARFFHANYVPAATKEMEGRKLAAFCGIGSPEHFFRMLRDYGASVVLSVTFRDHHVFTDRELLGLEQQAKAAGADALATTPKDAVRMSSSVLNFPFLVVDAALKIEEEQEFFEYLEQGLSPISAKT